MSAYKFFNKAFTKKSLVKTYQKHVEESTAVGLDKIGRDKFREEYLEQIKIIRRKALNNSYSFTPYKKKLISKGEHKNPRAISIPTIRDRITLRSLCNVLSQVFKDDLSIEIPQVKIQSINSNIKKDKFESYIKIDVSNFYPTIDHDILFSFLRKKIRKKQLLALIEKSVKNVTVNKSKKEKIDPNDTGVPQGLSVSNILAEIYLSDIDKKYKKKADIFFTRYVDDILIFCSEKEVDKLFDEIKQDFENIKLTIHELNKKKSKSQSGKITDEIHFLGYRYSDRKTSIIQKNKQKFEDSTANILTTFRYKYEKYIDDTKKGKYVTGNPLKVLEWRLNLKITGCIFENKKRGWMFYFSQIEDLKTLYSIDKTIKKLVSRFCSEDIHLKNLVKTFHETSRLNVSSHKYILNFDNLTASEKRNILEMYLGLDRLRWANDEQIHGLFGMRISQIIKEHEQDIGTVS